MMRQCEESFKEDSWNNSPSTLGDSESESPNKEFQHFAGIKNSLKSTRNLLTDAFSSMIDSTSPASVRVTMNDDLASESEPQFF